MVSTATTNIDHTIKDERLLIPKAIRKIILFMIMTLVIDGCKVSAVRVIIAAK
jgi:hypothetical protein